MTPETNYKLPDGWRWANLGDLCERHIGTRDPTLAPDDPFTYIDITSVDNSTKRITNPKVLLGREAPSRARQVVRTSDVLIATTRPNLNAAAMVDARLDDQVCSTGFCVLRSGSDLLPGFLFAYAQSQSFVEALTGLTVGAMYPAVTDSQVRAQAIPLPPTAEQRRIAAILTEQMAAVDRARAAAEAQLQAAQALPAACLREVFESDEANAWPRRTIGQVASLVVDGPHVTPSYVRKGIPFLTVRNIVNRRIDITDVSFISPEDHAQLCRRVKPQRGDILYTKDGTLGIPCVVDTDMEFSHFVSVALIRLPPSDADAHFAALALDSPQVRSQVEHLGAGAGLKHMVLKSIRALQLPLPSLPVQRDIVAVATEQSTAALCTHQAISAQLAAINALPAALLRQAFSGGL